MTILEHFRDGSLSFLKHGHSKRFLLKRHGAFLLGCGGPCCRLFAGSRSVSKIKEAIPLARKRAVDFDWALQNGILLLPT